MKPNSNNVGSRPKDAFVWTEEELEILKRSKRDSAGGIHRKKDGTIHNPDGAMRKFLEERCVLAGWIACDQLFLAWRAWCEEGQRSGYIGTRATFAMLMQKTVPGRILRRRAAVAGDRVYIYDGISLLGSADDSPVGNEF